MIPLSSDCMFVARDGRWIWTRSVIPRNNTDEIGDVFDKMALEDVGEWKRYE